VKPIYFLLPLALCLAGCSTCPKGKLAHSAKSLSGKGENGCVRRVADGAAQYRLSDLASETVYDKAGNKVARLDDLILSGNGRVVSVTLAPVTGAGSTVTVPFEKVRFKKERNGTVSLETDVVIKAPADGTQPAKPHKMFRFLKKPT
jgi:sporulation protein YlmC with PRC-barrel domain